MNNFIKHLVMLIAMLLASISVTVAADYSEIVRGDTLYFNLEEDSTLSFIGTSNKEIDSLFVPETVQGIEVTSIGKKAMGSCVALVYVKIPNSVRAIKSEAFSRCSSLESVILPEKTNTVEGFAFLGCEILQYVEIRCKDSHLNIQMLAFGRCVSLSVVKFYLSDFSWWGPCPFHYLFEDCPIQKIYLPKGAIYDSYCHSSISESVLITEEQIVEFDPEAEEENTPDNAISTILSDTFDGVIDVYNMQGIKVLSTTDKSAISALPKGIYLLQSNGNTEKYLVK